MLDGVIYAGLRGAGSAFGIKFVSVNLRGAEEDFRPHAAQARGASRTKVTVRRAFRAPAKPLLAVPISPIAGGTLVLER